MTEKAPYGNRIADVALRFVGYPYRWSGKTPDGFDCSGFVQYVVKIATGQTITGDSHTQMNLGTPIRFSDVQRGDILGYDTRNGREVREGNAVSHVGIYIGDGKMMSCLNESLGCRVSDLSTPYWNGGGARFITARRLFVDRSTFAPDDDYDAKTIDRETRRASRKVRRSERKARRDDRT